jgi:hypothetical protein
MLAYLGSVVMLGDPVGGHRVLHHLLTLLLNKTHFIFGDYYK